MSTYDQILEDINKLSQVESIPPIWTLPKFNEDTLNGWLVKALSNAYRANQYTANKQLTNQAIWSGIQWESQDPYADFRNAAYRPIDDTRKMVVNDHWRYVDSLKGKMTKYRPDVMPVPHTDDHDDKQEARVAKSVLESLDDQLDLDNYTRDLVERTIIYGYQPALTLWDECRGPISDRWLKAKERYKDKRMKFVRADWTYEPDYPERLGDLWCPKPLPWEMSFDMKRSPEECQWITWHYWRHKEEIKFDHPDKAKLIESIPANKQATQLDLENFLTVPLQDHLLYCRTWVRSSKHLRCGLYIESVPGVVLHYDDNPYSDLQVLDSFSEWGDLPLEVLRDIRLPDQMLGESSFRLITSLINTKNKLLTMWNREMQLLGHPKILVHRTAKVKSETLGNDITRIDWSGIHAPQVVNWSVTPSGLPEMYALLTEEIDKLCKTHPISQGTPPNGITAGIAIQLMEEIEDLQLTNWIKNQARFVVAFARKRLAIFGKLVQNEKDERYLHLIGKDNEDVVQQLNKDIFQKPYNIRLEHVNQQVRSPAAQEQKIIDLLNVKEDALTNEQIIDALTLIKPEKITDPAQAAVNAAELVCELCAEGKDIPPPRPGEHYTVKWNIMMSYYQRPGFTKLPKKHQKRFEEHLLGLEFLMSEHLIKNPAFANQLLALPQFPAFYNLPPGQLGQAAQVPPLQQQPGIQPGQVQPSPGSQMPADIPQQTGNQQVPQ